MQKRNYSFEELRTALLEKLKNQACSPITITGYRYQCNSIFKWMRKNDYNHYSEEGANKYLQDYCAKYGKNRYYATLRTVIYRLNDISKDTWSDVHSDKGRHFCLPDTFVEIVNRYCSWNVRTGHAAGTIRNKRYAVSWFLEELSKQKCKSLEEMSPILITQACIKVTDHNLWGEIRIFFVGNYYRIIRRKAGINNSWQIKNGRGACLHCFRHTFAVRSFAKNERNGIKARESVPFLSTYLGHDSLYETEKYLKFSGNYFEDTLTKFNDYSGELFPEVIIYE